MSVKLQSRKSLYRLSAWCLLTLLVTGCAQQPPPEPYSEPAREASPARLSAVGALQQEADKAMKSGNFPLAIETLQRAIRIEPRNPYSWHYLGLTYLEMNDLSRCLAMAERSAGFLSSDNQLLLANERLQKRCAAN